jgi:DNA-binding MarR family transcriptional regulator
MADLGGLEAALQRHEGLMERMMVLMKGHIAHLCRQQDLTPPQLWALQNIEGAGSLKVSPLAACLGLSMGATSTLVDRLVARDLVTRRQDPEDRRAVFVSITEKGAQAVGMVRQSRRALFAAILGSMDPSHREALLNGFEQMVVATERVVAPPGDLGAAGLCPAMGLDEG